MMNELQRTKQWFELAVPTPTDKNKLVQIGVCVEEIAEMFTAIGADPIAAPLDNLATVFKTGESATGLVTIDDLSIDRKELLDALCDIIVTAVGIGHMLNIDVVTAYTRVNDSNWSKFVNGTPVFDANGKIQKGSNYTKPNLEGLY